jgi:hypothetical protein
MNVVIKKRCARCLVEKPANAFHKNSSRPDGLQTWCKRCLLTQQKAAHAARSIGKVNARRIEIQARPELGKVCCNCGLVKPLSEYGKDRRKQDGRQARCASCAAPGRRAAWARYRAKKSSLGYVSKNEPMLIAKNSEPLSSDGAQCANLGTGGVPAPTSHPLKRSGVEAHLDPLTLKTGRAVPCAPAPAAGVREGGNA